MVKVIYIKVSQVIRGQTVWSQYWPATNCTPGYNHTTIKMSHSKSNGETHKGLRVLIAGAGIGGLTAAIALRQQGHRVEVSK